MTRLNVRHLRYLWLLLAVVAGERAAFAQGQARVSPHVTVGANAVPKGGDPDAAITGEWAYPTPLILEALGLGSWKSEEHRAAFDVHAEEKKEQRRLRPEADRPTGFEDLRRRREEEKAELKRPKFADLVCPAPERGLRVLSLGEGYSGLVPYLRSIGMEAMGVDLWYGEINEIVENSRAREAAGEDRIVGAEIMIEYVRTHRDSLLTGSATDLGRLRRLGKPHGIADQSVDLVLSHQLFQYLDLKDQISMIEEVLRVLKPGGSARIVYYSDDAKVDEKIRTCVTAAGADFQAFDVSVTRQRLKNQPIIDTFKGDALERVRRTKDFEYAETILSMKEKTDWDEDTLIVIKKADVPKTEAAK